MRAEARRIAIVGGGPGGLYCALLLKRADPDRDVVLFEKNPPDATYGWGVVFSDRTLSSFREADYATFVRITDNFVLWDAIDVRVKDRVVRCGGQVFSGIARMTLLELLQERCTDLGVQMNFQTEIADHGEWSDFDLVVGADGVHSPLRQELSDHLRPAIAEGATRYIWFGTDRPFDSFTFAFRETEFGLFQAHAYPFEGAMSTFIVECPESSWRAAGLDRTSEGESIAFCEKVFGADLLGHSLRSNNSKWLTFPTLKCRTWHHGKFVLLGDAVHTAHFSIGSGTKLAMEDAIALVNSFQEHGDIDRALNRYEMDRKPRVGRFQEAARQSQTYFENTSRYVDLDAERFAFGLLTRSGRIDYSDLRTRDPHFVTAVDRATRREEPTLVVAPPPAFNSIVVGGLALSNRIVVSPPPTDGSVDGAVGMATAETLVTGARSGAALVVTEPIAVSAAARLTTGSPGIYEAAHEGAWGRVVQDVHRDGAGIAAQIGHAGPRGATRPRQNGTDLPSAEPWPLVAASPYRYAPWGEEARAATESDFAAVTEDFRSAARRVRAAGFDALGVHMAAGDLLATFLSPLTNTREDDYGGDLTRRMRWPLDLFHAVRREWEGMLFATVSATDAAAGGLRVPDAVDLCRRLKDAGCDLVRVVTGQNVFNSRPRYDRYWLVHYSDVLRNEAHVATLPGLSLDTVDQINTAIAAGRADLCGLRALG
ncbi:MAG: FAD-dependent monooxygenase [Actinomycetota bacterium]|nr:FAD-dependent monooxygenase [Actinomycetota bacterium]